MRSRITIGAFVLALFGVALVSDAAASTRDGSTINRAIIITRAADRVWEESNWVYRLYPDADIHHCEYTLHSEKGRSYDHLVVPTAHGRKDVYFDVTAVQPEFLDDPKT